MKGGLSLLETSKAPPSSSVVNNMIPESSESVHAVSASSPGTSVCQSKEETAAEGLGLSSAALAALGEKDFVEEAGSCIQDLQLAAGDMWAKALGLYANGMGSDQMPWFQEVPEYRGMAPPGVVQYLLDHCDRVTLWLFTWDLVRSPAEYFKSVCEYLQRPEMEALLNVIRSMAVGTLRLKAAELQTEREEAKGEYERAKLEQLPATQLSALHRWMLRAVAETPARIDLVRLFHMEARTFKGTRYADALSFVHQHFQEYGCYSLEPFTAPVVGSTLTWLLDHAQPAMNTAIHTVEPESKAVGEGSNGWVFRHQLLRMKEDEALMKVLNELKDGYEKLLVGSEPRLHFEKVRDTCSRKVLPFTKDAA